MNLKETIRCVAFRHRGSHWFSGDICAVFSLIIASYFFFFLEFIQKRYEHVTEQKKTNNEKKTETLLSVSQSNVKFDYKSKMLATIY